MASMDDRLNTYIASHGRHSSPQSRRSPGRGNTSLKPTPRRSAPYCSQERAFDAHGFGSTQPSSSTTDAALDKIIAVGRHNHLDRNTHEAQRRPRRASTANINEGLGVTISPRKYRDSQRSLKLTQDQGLPLSSLGNDYASDRARYNKARVEWKAHDPQQSADPIAFRAPQQTTLSGDSVIHPSLNARRSPSPWQIDKVLQSDYRKAPALTSESAFHRHTAPHKADEPRHIRLRMSSTIDSFLGQILQSVNQRDGQRLTSFIILDFDSLSADRRQPYGDLHTELNQRYPVTKDAALSTKVKQALPADQLLSCHAAFTESIVQYFRYVRDYVNDSALLKARKIEKLTRHDSCPFLTSSFTDGIPDNVS